MKKCLELRKIFQHRKIFKESVSTRYFLFVDTVSTWYFLFVDTVSTRYILFVDTVSTRYFLFVDTVSTRYFLFVDTVSMNRHLLLIFEYYVLNHICRSYQAFYRIEINLVEKKL